MEVTHSSNLSTYSPSYVSYLAPSASHALPRSFSAGEHCNSTDRHRRTRSRTRPLISSLPRLIYSLGADGSLQRHQLSMRQHHVRGVTTASASWRAVPMRTDAVCLWTDNGHVQCSIVCEALFRWARTYRQTGVASQTDVLTKRLPHIDEKDQWCSASGKTMVRGWASTYYG